MTKKGGVQQLQADIQNDEDFQKLLQLPGLLVLDVYSDWCGPCLGMVGSLKKIKLELGGDNLHLAICKADNITILERFRRKSEPTWIFVMGGKAINLMFGTNVPRLIELITLELAMLKDGVTGRPTYKLSEYLPEEIARIKIREDAVAAAKRIETAERDKKLLTYLTYVTDTIMENLSDIGVTIFGPQVNRDMFKKLNEPAEALKIQCKNRKVAQVTKSDFDIINFNCPNPIDNDILEHLYGKELLVCFWKVHCEDEDVPTKLQQYAFELTKSQTESPDGFNVKGEPVPPIIAPVDIEVEYEIDGDSESLEEEQPEPTNEATEAKEMSEEADEDNEDLEDELDIEAGSNSPSDEISTLNHDFDLEDTNIDQIETPEKIIPRHELVKKRMGTKTITIPPIWVANNQRTHAALIYVFFHNQTTQFLPPDPTPETPHVIMAFEAYKKRDLIPYAESHKDVVLLYGFFTSEDPNEAKYISNCVEKYKQVSLNDKLIFKVNYTSSNNVLSLVTYGPSYISANTVVGYAEAKILFPDTYKTAEEEAEEEAAKIIKKQKSKKSKKTVESTDPITSSTSGEDESGDSTAEADDETMIENGEPA